MREDFPYQVVVFLGDEPDIGEPVYNGPSDWFAQIALKRRFNLVGESETDLLERLKRFCSQQQPFRVSVGELIKPERMPVKVLEIKPNPQLMEFHMDLINALGKNLISRYPERDGVNYSPHVTAEYDGRFVIDIERFKNCQFLISKLCLLKDSQDDSLAHKYFKLSQQ